MKRIAPLFFGLLVGVTCFPLFFKPLPVSAGSHLPPLLSEHNLQSARQNLETFDRSLTLQQRKILRETPPFEKNSLSPSLRVLFKKRLELKKEVKVQEGSLSLQNELLDLFQKGSGSPETMKRRIEESGKIAKIAIRAFGELQQKYQMIRPAVLHNILVNAGLKKEGFCWHWTRDLMARLKRVHPREFDFLWATAHESTIREHNSLVVVPHGARLEEGLLLDGWRKSGEPFWVKVSTDKYPWGIGAYTQGEISEETAQ